MVTKNQSSEPIHIIGCGTAFESIIADREGYGLPSHIYIHRLDGVACLSQKAKLIIEQVPPTSPLFLSADENALNYARLELYLPAKLRGHELITLIHKSACVAPDAKISENSWIAPKVTIASKCILAPNVFISTQARLDSHSSIGSHSWLGPGSSLGFKTKIGKHCVVGANTHLGTDIEIGNHCIVDKPGIWNQPLANGTFVEAMYQSPATMIGHGYSIKY
ncbi:hypothetical protein [Delftia tsuruhatensis]|uniref:hypothetical protein n=1 Tax=Delftia tsuruhatensis TaxID=180282 RepID=UPI0009E44D2E|nr:hypothetical protein [Delftia tsuruhatensis]